MKIPAFVKQKDVLGVFAPSAGVGRKLTDFNRSLAQVRKQGFNIKCGELVEVNDMRSGTGKQRAEELKQLHQDETVKALLCAAGGDFLIEMWPFVDFETLATNPKWMMGYSDPTSLLYTMTTKYDVATLYGSNAGSFDYDEVPDWQMTALELLQGNKVVQESLEFCDPCFRDGLPVYETENHWHSFVGDLKTTGRFIGGCLDSLKDVFGTSLDGTKDFIKRYQDETLIWYFDIYSMTAENVYRTLLQMKNMGCFRKQDVVLVGRVLFPSSETGMSYEEALRRAIECPVIMEADIGHTYPRMMVVNGGIGTLEVKASKGTITFDLENQ